MESNITSDVINLPKSCRSTMDRMVEELEKEDQQDQDHENSETNS